MHQSPGEIFYMSPNKLSDAVRGHEMVPVHVRGAAGGGGGAAEPGVHGSAARVRGHISRDGERVAGLSDQDLEARHDLSADVPVDG